MTDARRLPRGRAWARAPLTGPLRRRAGPHGGGGQPRGPLGPGARARAGAGADPGRGALGRPGVCGAGGSGQADSASLDSWGSYKLRAGELRAASRVVNP